MPLIKSKSPKAFDKNVKEEMNAGKPKDQSLAIAYSMKRQAPKAKKMAEGGEVTPMAPVMSRGSIVDAIRAKKAPPIDRSLTQEDPDDFEDQNHEAADEAMDDAYEKLDMIAAIRAKMNAKRMFR